MLRQMILLPEQNLFWLKIMFMNVDCSFADWQALANFFRCFLFTNQFKYLSFALRKVYWLLKNRTLVCYFFLQRYEKAEAYLLGSLAARPEDIQAYGLIARSYYNRGQNQKAKECLRIAIELLKKDGNAGALAEVNDFLQTIP